MTPKYILVIIALIVLIAGLIYYQPVIAPTHNGNAPVWTNVSNQNANINSNPGPKTKFKLFYVAIDDGGKLGKKIGCNDSLVSVDRQIDYTPAPLQAALSVLLAMKNQYEPKSGLYNSLYQSNLKIDSLNIVDGKATVRLSGTMILGGECDDPRFGEQLKATIMQFPAVKSAVIYINGKLLDKLLGGKG